MSELTTKKIIKTVITHLKINGQEYSVKPEIIENNIIRITATGLEKGLKTIYQKDFSFENLKALLNPIKKYTTIDLIYKDLLQNLSKDVYKLTNRGENIDLVIDEHKKINLTLIKIFSGYVDETKSLKEENAKLKAQLKKLLTKNESLSDELIKKETTEIDINYKNEENSNKIKNLNKKISSLEFQITELGNIIKDKDIAIKQYNDKLKENSKLTQSLISENKTLKNDLEEKDQIISELNEEIKDFQEVVKQCQETYIKTTTTTKNWGGENLTQELHTKKKLIKEKDKEIKKLKGINEKLLKEIEKYKIKINNIENLFQKTKKIYSEGLKNLREKNTMLDNEKRKRREKELEEQKKLMEERRQLLEQMQTQAQTETQTTTTQNQTTKKVKFSESTKGHKNLNNQNRSKTQVIERQFKTITRVNKRKNTVNENEPEPEFLSASMLNASQIQVNRPTIVVSGEEIITTSEILENMEEVQMIEKRLGKTDICLQLLYKATRDGDRSAIFHEYVRDTDNTITFIKTTTGNRFGGYTAETWDGTNIFKEDHKAFIFSLNLMKCYDVNEKGVAIWCYPKYGPIFEGFQIDIFDHFLEKDYNKTGYLGEGYSTTEDFELNEGEEEFQVEEMEVYQIA